LFNNAGVGITGPLEEIPSEEIKNNFETNLFGPIE
jgi:NAD(P)-dependent dehydrogenase (short-subunit alcohol dehydrogenase family)